MFQIRIPPDLFPHYLRILLRLFHDHPKANKDAAGRSRKEEQEKQRLEKERLKKLAPQDMFRSQSDKYSKFDGDGVPTHDEKGEEIPKSGVKKLRKEWEKQKKLFEAG